MGYHKHLMRLLIGLSLFFVLISETRCISWNVRTKLKSEIFPYGRLNRSGEIELAAMGTDSLGNKYKTSIDTVKAKGFLESEYVLPSDIVSEHFETQLDSIYSLHWIIARKNPSAWFWDYRKLSEDSNSFSGNRINCICDKRFFKTDYEYKEIFFDSIDADSIMSNLSEFITDGENSFWEYIGNSPKAGRYSKIIADRKQNIKDDLNDYWSSLVKMLLYDTAVLNNNGDFFDSLHTVVVDKIISYFPISFRTPNLMRTIEKAVENGDSVIENTIKDYGFNIWGAYDISDNGYYFNLSLSLPGRIEATNADSVDGSNLKWNFTNYDFRGKELILYARSSEYHWFNLIIVVLVVMGLITLIMLIVTSLIKKEKSALY